MIFRYLLYQAGNPHCVYMFLYRMRHLDSFLWVSYFAFKWKYWDAILRSINLAYVNLMFGNISCKD